MSTTRLKPFAIRDEILPDDPKILVAAALQLYPRPTAERQLFLDKAVALLENQTTPLKGKDLRAQALIQSALGRSEEALAIYQAALAYEPRQVTWRFEFAQLLFQQKRLQEARDEMGNLVSNRSCRRCTNNAASPQAGHHRNHVRSHLARER